MEYENRKDDRPSCPHCPRKFASEIGLNVHLTDKHRNQMDNTHASKGNEKLSDDKETVGKSTSPNDCDQTDDLLQGEYNRDIAAHFDDEGPGEICVSVVGTVMHLPRARSAPTAPIQKSNYTRQASYNCRQCSEPFCSLRQLARHKRKCHDESPAKRSVRKKNRPSWEDIFCPHCKKGFASKYGFNLHVLECPEKSKVNNESQNMPSGEEGIRSLNRDESISPVVKKPGKMPKLKPLKVKLFRIPVPGSKSTKVGITKSAKRKKGVAGLVTVSEPAKKEVVSPQTNVTKPTETHLENQNPQIGKDLQQSQPEMGRNLTPQKSSSEANKGLQTTQKSDTKVSQMPKKMTKVSPAKPFQCSKCKNSYKYAWNLKRHLKKEHLNKGEHLSKTEGQSLKMKEAKASGPMKKVKASLPVKKAKASLPVKEPERTTRTLDDLKLKLSILKKKKEKPAGSPYYSTTQKWHKTHGMHRCDQPGCGYSCRSLTFLNYHKRKTHGISPSKTSPSAVKRSKRLISKDQHSTDELAPNQENVAKLEELLSKAVKDKDGYACYTCPKIFNRKSNLKIHLSVHTGLYRWECTLCQAGFNRRYHLERHMMNVHQSKAEKTAITRPKALSEDSSVTSPEARATLSKAILPEVSSIMSIKAKATLSEDSSVTSHKPRATLSKVPSVITPKAKATLPEVSSITSPKAKATLSEVSSIMSPKPRATLSKMPSVISPKSKATLPKHNVKVEGKVDDVAANEENVAKLDELASSMKVENEFICNTCEKSFKDKPRLMDHLAVHTGIYRFTCPICSKGTNHKDRHKEHMDKHKLQAEGGENPLDGKVAAFQSSKVKDVADKCSQSGALKRTRSKEMAPLKSPSMAKNAAVTSTKVPHIESPFDVALAAQKSSTKVNENVSTKKTKTTAKLSANTPKATGTVIQKRSKRAEGLRSPKSKEASVLGFLDRLKAKEIKFLEKDRTKDTADLEGTKSEKIEVGKSADTSDVILETPQTKDAANILSSKAKEITHIKSPKAKQLSAMSPKAKEISHIKSPKAEEISHVKSPKAKQLSAMSPKAKEISHVKSPKAKEISHVKSPKAEEISHVKSPKAKQLSAMSPKAKEISHGKSPKAKQLFAFSPKAKEISHVKSPKAKQLSAFSPKAKEVSHVKSPKAKQLSLVTSPKSNQGSALKSPTSKVHLPIHSELRCYKCEDDFESAQALRDHMKFHQPVIFSCDTCEATFKQPGSLREHRKCHEPEPPVHECHLCEQTFKVQEYLQLHLMEHSYM